MSEENDPKETIPLFEFVELVRGKENLINRIFNLGAVVKFNNFIFELLYEYDFTAPDVFKFSIKEPRVSMYNLEEQITPIGFQDVNITLIFEYSTSSEEVHNRISSYINHVLGRITQAKAEREKAIDLYNKQRIENSKERDEYYKAKATAENKAEAEKQINEELREQAEIEKHQENK